MLLPRESRFYPIKPRYLIQPTVKKIGLPYNKIKGLHFFAYF
ncbi:Hypothetical protein I595_1662 [Croceitalea dokdonensis DOKDO 023]|uniref:Uncharacterized protein n=1 Tax=Croceitalea dokdonensis DOKDO 023 TaxID=1300341 RepID=A0A0P7AFC5_9FLAO|nr:Hypothetical protein I595_1662 [Croceitalea dokdonensis DOKDO 023]